MTNPTIDYLRLDSLNVDQSYQRPLNLSRLREGGDLHPFRPEAFGVGSVSRRDNGTLWLMDAQHRTEKGKESGHGASTFPFLVYQGLTVADEAAMFRHLNNFKQVVAADRFRARVIEGDPVALALQRILTNHGWRVAGGGNAGCFAAVASLESVHNGMRLRPEGGQLQVCELVISILTEAFGHNGHAVKGELISGLGLFLLRHSGIADIPKLVLEMGKLEGGALGLIGNAKYLRSLRGGSIPNAMAEVIVGLHNRGRRTRLLPEWTRA